MYTCVHTRTHPQTHVHIHVLTHIDVCICLPIYKSLQNSNSLIQFLQHTKNV